MIEVGAAGPTFLSMSRHFRESGWTVLAIEPNPHFIAQHAAAGLNVLPFACGDRDADGVDFEMVHQPVAYAGGEISYESFSALKVTAGYREHNPSISTTTIKVNLRRLDTILRDCGVRAVDLLSVDVEGWELQVMDGLTVNPSVVVLENFLRDPSYALYMRRRGYYFYSEHFPNHVFARRS
jgi:FkbM family methyltransferase